jgi:hypothetical protein
LEQKRERVGNGPEKFEEVFIGTLSKEELPQGQSKDKSKEM